jgi:hypothetical protein
VHGRVLAVGDAAFAHNPIAGRGLSFALGSAFAAAATVVSWRNRPADYAAAVEYYEEYVAAERRRHLAFLTSLGGERTAAPRPLDPNRPLSWRASVAVTPVAFPEGIRSQLAVVLPDGAYVRWLGNFDLLVFRSICAVPTRAEALLRRLCALDLGSQEAALLLQWAVQHGVLAEVEAEHERRPASPI